MELSTSDTEKATPEEENGRRSCMQLRTLFLFPGIFKIPLLLYYFPNSQWPSLANVGEKKLNYA